MAIRFLKLLFISQSRDGLFHNTDRQIHSMKYTECGHINLNSSITREAKTSSPDAISLTQRSFMFEMDHCDQHCVGPCNYNRDVIVALTRPSI